MSRSSKWRARPAARLCGLLCGALLLACGAPSDPGGGNEAPCGAPPGDWKYILSCDSTFGASVHQCIDYYATVAAVDSVGPSFKAVCGALGGKVLASKCPSAGSIGSCVETSSTGPTGSASLGALEQQYFYAMSGTAASLQSSCERQKGVYLPASDSSSPAPSGSTGATCNTPSPGKAGSGVAFSISTDANGQVIECTNYVGSITPAQLQSVLNVGASTSPCPAANVLCACPTPGSSTFGTTATLVYYHSPSGSSTETCPVAGPSCSSTYTPP
jgi:hypothetical protein